MPRYSRAFGVSLAALLVAPVNAPAASLGPAVEGVLGIPLGPDRTFWDFRTPTSLLAQKQFVVAVSGGISQVLNREYRTGRRDRGYAVGVGGGAVAPWDYGVSGVWALGSGQAQHWTHPTALYSVTPSPKIGVMAVSHAWEKGPWALGGTVYRTSFSLSDTFVFERFPTSSNPRVNTFLFDLLPEAIGQDIAYDALGNRLALYGDAVRTSRLGRLGVVLSAWTASADWLTQHANTITDAHFKRDYLAGTKTGDGHGGWHGMAAEGRWGSRLGDRLDVELRFGRGRWSGDANLWLRNPARVPTEDGQSSYEIEPREWAGDSVSSDSWKMGLHTTWLHSSETVVGAGIVWENHDLSTSGFGRTPVLTLLGGSKDLVRVEQSARFNLVGSLDVLGMDVSFAHHPRDGRWQWDGTLGLVQIGGWLDSDLVPNTMGFSSSRSRHSWAWKRLRLAFAEISATRQMTQQIAFTYTFRQYLPISGSWERDKKPSSAPGGVSGIRLGSMHQVRAAMRL